MSSKSISPAERRDEEAFGVALDQDHAARKKEFAAADIDVALEIGFVTPRKRGSRCRDRDRGLGRGVMAQEDDGADRCDARDVRRMRRQYGGERGRLPIRVAAIKKIAVHQALHMWMEMGLGFLDCEEGVIPLALGA
jgi:hypothetical protein